MLALSGFPFLSGFFSKDLILAVAYQAHPLCYWVGVFTAFLTAFYMTRLVVVAFLGSARTPAAEHPHESPAVMTVPLLILAVLSVIGGFIGIGAFYHLWSVDQLRLTGQGAADGTGVALPELPWFLGTVMPLVMVFGGFLLGFQLYRRAERDPLHLPALAHKFYIDEFYDRSLVGGQQVFARTLNWIDSWILDGFLLRGAAYLSVGVGELLKLVQTGSLQTYAFILSVGGGLLIYFTLFGHS
jgi:NADH-quinone oxidoreductase subunit L